MPGPSCSLSRIQMRFSHFCEAEPGPAGMIRRTGPPWMFGSGWPFIAQTIIVRVHRLGHAHAARQRRPLGIARQMQIGAVMRGVDSGRGFTPGRLEHVGERTPVHSAQPAPPLVHWLPRAGGEKNERPLPPHSSTMRRVCGLNFDFSSPSVISSGC
jgi:hypothetical protein